VKGGGGEFVRAPKWIDRDFYLPKKSGTGQEGRSMVVVAKAGRISSRGKKKESTRGVSRNKTKVQNTDSGSRGEREKSFCAFH